MKLGSRFSVRAFLLAVPLTIVGLMVVGAATRLMPIGPVGGMGVVGVAAAAGVGFTALKKRWDVALAIVMTLIALSVFFIWLTSRVGGTID